MCYCVRLHVGTMRVVVYCSVFQKTYSYVQRFSGTKDPVANQASVTELREYVLLLLSYCHNR
jgi:hypothetical protein